MLDDDTPTSPDGKPPSRGLKLVSENKPAAVKRNRETLLTRATLDNA